MREGLSGQVRPAREQVLPVRRQTDQPPSGAGAGAGGAATGAGAGAAK